MIERLRGLLLSALSACLLTTSALAGGPAAAQEQPANANKSQQPPQDLGYTVEEAAAFNAFITAAAVDEKIKLAEQFLATYPNSKLAQNGSKGLVGYYVQKGDMDKAFAHGAAHLAKYAGDFGVELILADTASRQAKSANHKFDEQGLKYAGDVIARIEKGEGIPGVPIETWNAQKNGILASMHQSMGLFLKSKGDAVAAAEELRKAGELDGTDPVTFYLLGETLMQGEYAQLRKKYDELPEKLTDEAKALLAQADQVVDKIIVAYAQTVALGGTNASFQGLVAATKPNLEKFYKYRHNSLDGLQELIEKCKPGANSTSPTSKS